MAAINKKLESLSLKEIETISIEYLMGWHDLYHYGFRIKGLNKKRESYNLSNLTEDLSFTYRIEYIQRHYSSEEIEQLIKNYLSSHTVSDERWKGIEIFDCRFGREYAKAFKTLLGSSAYRKISEEMRVLKLSETQMRLYGGIGLAGKQAHEKATQTNLERYGTENVMNNESIKEKLAGTNTKIYGGKSPFCSKDICLKASSHKLQNIRSEMNEFQKNGTIDKSVFNQSPAEMIVFYELISRFGKSDVYYQYGRHPYDARYPFSCDFYIKSLDLFIEINAHYSHGSHWFDDKSHDDCLRRDHLLNSNSKRSRVSVDTWCNKDVKKRNKARVSEIKYLVFWDNSYRQENKKRIPNLKDFYEWFIKYDCDYEAFVIAYPKNTY